MQEQTRTYGVEREDIYESRGGEEVGEVGAESDQPT